MVIPTNDSFIGNGDPLAYQVFNALGEINDMTGVFTIQVFGSDIWDAGTEVNVEDEELLVLGMNDILAILT